jgi:hypothetical protein
VLIFRTWVTDKRVGELEDHNAEKKIFGIKFWPFTVTLILNISVYRMFERISLLPMAMYQLAGFGKRPRIPEYQICTSWPIYRN